jgi:hypothetical protein
MLFPLTPETCPHTKAFGVGVNIGVIISAIKHERYE